MREQDANITDAEIRPAGRSLRCHFGMRNDRQGQPSGRVLPV